VRVLTGRVLQEAYDDATSAVERSRDRA
jgi:hypothetical protein